MRLLDLIVLIFAALSGVMGADLRSDSHALRACRYMPSVVVRKACLETVKGHKFNEDAVEVCARGRDYSDDYGPFTLDCLRNIRDQNFDFVALKACERIADHNLLLNCLKKIAGHKPTGSGLVTCDRKTRDPDILLCIQAVEWDSLTPVRENIPRDAPSASGR